MPAGDQTGPTGMGPMTGRGAGICATGQVNNAGRGFGMGRGRGFGRGFGYRAAAAPSPLTREEQIEALRAQAAGLELQFKTLTEQIGKLESE